MFLTETTGLCTIWRFQSCHIVVFMSVLFFDYLPVLVVGGFALIAALHHAWQFRIRPRLIPTEKIKLLADGLIAAHGDRAEEIAFINEDRAWRYSDSVKQGKWRRVRLELRQRLYRIF